MISSKPGEPAYASAFSLCGQLGGLDGGYPVSCLPSSREVGGKTSFDLFSFNVLVLAGEAEAVSQPCALAAAHQPAL